MRATLLLPGLLFCAMSSAAPAARWLTLTEGSTLSVSSSADHSVMAIELVGRIWVLDAASGEARALTAGSRPAVSPDGDYIAFEQAIGGRQQIVIVPSAGGLPRQVTFGDYDHRSPAWHPSGERLVLSSDRGGSFDIWALELPDLRLRQLSFAPGDERDPAWDQSGTRLVYVGSTADGADGLFVREADAQQRLLLSDTARLHGPAWRPENGLIAYVRRSAGHGELRLLLLSDPPASKGLSRAENVFPVRPTWHGAQRLIYVADGRIRRRHLDRFAAEDLPFSARVAIPATPPRGPARPAAVSWPQPVRGIDGVDADGDHCFVGALGAIWALDATGDVSRQFGQAGAVDRQPALAPDRRRLAWVSDADGLPQVWVQALDSDRARALSPDNLSAFAPAWQPDGRAVAYLATSGDSARQDVVLQAADGQAPPQHLARGLRQLTGLHWTAADSLRVARSGGLPDLLLHIPDGRLTTATDGLRQACGPADGRWLAGLDAGGRLRLRRASGESVRLLLDQPVQAFGCTADEALWYRVADSLWRLQPDAPGSARRQPLGLQWRPAEAVDRLVLRVGRLFDGLGPGYAERRDIVIENGRIAAIEPWQQPPPAGRFIDARELTALPGLIDLGGVPLPALRASEGRAWLDAGVTTVRFNTTRHRAVSERAESWLSGALAGPRVFVAGSACKPTAATPGAPLAGLHLCDRGDIDLPGQIERAHASAQPAIARQAFPALLLPIDELRLADTSPRGAERFGIHGDIIEIAGARGLRLASELTSLMPLPAAPVRGAGLATHDQALFAPPLQLAWRQHEPGSALMLRERAQALFRAAGRGARVVAAADGQRWPPGLGLQAELRALHSAGLQPFEVLRMATRDAAAALDQHGELGVLKPGAAADLLLVAGDPLRDLEATARPSLVVLGGRAYQPRR